jgi:uncharacterized protein (DUF2252 family)
MTRIVEQSSNGVEARLPRGSTDSSPADRAAIGKDVRKEAPRSSHAEWNPPPDRRSPVDVLCEQDEARVQELVPIRHGRMLVSAFTFYRGAAAVMAADLARTPVSGLEVQLCGDAHLSNFGVYAAPDRDLVFDCNDFDETLPGPFEWDVKRLAASLAIAGRDRGFGKRERRTVALAATAEYRTAMRDFAAMRDIEVWYARFDVKSVLGELGPSLKGSKRREVEKALDKAQHKDSLRALAKLTRRIDGEPRIISDPPLIWPIEQLAGGRDVEAELTALLAAYRRTLASDRRHLVGRYRYADAAHKVVGVGSVGTRAWILLLLGRDDDDPLFLQAKEAGASVLEPYSGRSRFNHHGRRVVEGQRLMQAASDIFLGWVTVESGLDGSRHEFYVRQLWDGKGSANVDGMRPSDMAIYARLCGWTLARAHARSGDRIAIAAYLGGGTTFDEAIADFAEAYADQNERDYAEMMSAVQDGRIAVEEGL